MHEDQAAGRDRVSVVCAVLRAGLRVGGDVTRYAIDPDFAAMPALIRGSVAVNIHRCAADVLCVLRGGPLTITGIIDALKLEHDDPACVGPMLAVLAMRAAGVVVKS